MHQAKEMAYEKKTLEKDITHNLKKKNLSSSINLENSIVRRGDCGVKQEPNLQLQEETDHLTLGYVASHTTLKVTSQLSQ